MCFPRAIVIHQVPFSMCKLKTCLIAKPQKKIHVIIIPLLILYMEEQSRLESVKSGHMSVTSACMSARVSVCLSFLQVSLR